MKPLVAVFAGVVAFGVGCPVAALIISGAPVSGLASFLAGFVVIAAVVSLLGLVLFRLDNRAVKP